MGVPIAWFIVLAGLYRDPRLEATIYNLGGPLSPSSLAVPTSNLRFVDGKRGRRSSLFCK